MLVGGSAETCAKLKFINLWIHIFSHFIDKVNVDAVHSMFGDIDLSKAWNVQNIHEKADCGTRTSESGWCEFSLQIESSKAISCETRLHCVCSKRILKQTELVFSIDMYIQNEIIEPKCFIKKIPVFIWKEKFQFVKQHQSYTENCTVSSSFLA